MRIITSYIKPLLIVLIGVFVTWESDAQLREYSFEEVDSLISTSRPLVVFLHTDWCQFCVQMENTTFQNNEVISRLNEDFYFIRLNGESKEDILYKGHMFKYQPTGANTGVHELAQQLGTIKGKLNYPSLCILNTENEIIFQYGGMMTADELIRVCDSVSNL